ncbi:hypothetical protein FJTKL_12430 [Diaporthe vaccinii]|uniref:Uncharacterized protein n=1 Tax=Diaporthe vaccinii TaxID=105482 RepID=A0ABR4EDT3_9PEZI
MFRTGKKQELRRNFRFISMFGFTMILMASWQSIISVSNIGFVNGGTAGLIWMFFIRWVAFIFINTSMYVSNISKSLKHCSGVRGNSVCVAAGISTCVPFVASRF